MKIITFISDFGIDDWFVGAVKAVILKIDANIKIIDIAHTIRSHDIASAAFILKSVYRTFPNNTVHLAVVDPGVGSERKPIIIESEKYFFVGPDNGIFSFIDPQKMKAYEISVKTQTSTTFHGRDIFGPVAAQIAINKSPSDFGKRLHHIHRFNLPEPKIKDEQINGEIVYIDHFGNLITNISIDHKIKYLEVSGNRVLVKDFYGQTGEDEIVCLKGSSGYYEIACYKKSAKKLLRARIGEKIRAIFE